MRIIFGQEAHSLDIAAKVVRGAETGMFMTHVFHYRKSIHAHAVQVNWIFRGKTLDCELVLAL